MLCAQKNYFELLELPPVFDVDLIQLEKQYFAAQRAFHPDRLIGKTAQEKTRSIALSMTVNTAYETLKFPLKRALYLLEMYRVGDAITPSPALLMEVMETRETLNEAYSKSAIEKVAKDNDKAKADTLEMLSKTFAEKKFTVASEYTARLSYILKIEEELKRKLRSLPHE